MRRRLPFNVLMALLFSLVVLSVGGIIGMLAYEQQRNLSLAAIADVFARSLRESQSELANTYVPVQAQIALLAASLTRSAKIDEQIPLLAQLLESSPAVGSINIRMPQEAQLTLTPLPHAAARQQASAPPQAAYRLENSNPAGRSIRFFDSRLQLLDVPQVMMAQSMPPQETSLPVQQAVVTPAGALVIQANIALGNLSAIVAQLRATPSTQLALFDQSGHLLAASPGMGLESHSGSLTSKDSPAATLRAMNLPILAAVLEQPQRGVVFTYDSDGSAWQALAQTSEVAPGLATLTVMAAPHDEILAGARDLLQHSLWAILIGMGVTIPLIWWLAHLMTDTLRRMADTAAQMRDFRFTEKLPRSFVLELDVIARTMQQMQETIQRFLDISARLAAERQYDRLLEEIVAETMAAAHASAGAVYLFEAEQRLQPMAWKKIGGKAPLPPALIAPRLCPPFETALAQSNPLQISLSPARQDPGLEWLSAWFPGQTIELLLVPLRNRSRENLGILLLARGATEGAYDADLIAFIDALSGTMAITIEKQTLLTGRKALLDGVIRMIAGAIDARSPYTSAHCQRVPELVALLATAAAEHPSSPYRDAVPFNDITRETLHLAAWLHDCGKLFVPDYIADKAVKLEAVYNRIHEIRTRFEVLKRDAEIAYWRDLAQGGDAKTLQEKMQNAWQELDTDYAFIAECNLGERKLDEHDIVRLEQIGRRTWFRTLDDRIGISTLERLRKESVPPRALPAPEHLMADRLEHFIDAQANADPASTKETRLHMTRPRHHLNLGELYSLSVRSGTLTNEERYLINAHILGTIAMLSTLPFPAELASVPEIAGSHHEHLDGSGYPFGKRAEDLPLAARMIAIADVYEALTATDRPYKPGLTIDDALAIMADMAARQHLDPELFELFVRADIPATYATTQTAANDPEPASPRARTNS